MEEHSTIKYNSLSTKKQILYHLLKGVESRVDLAEELNITKAAVTQLVNELIKEEIVIEKGELGLGSDEKKVRGRRRVCVTINPNYKLTFGVAIEKDKVMVGLTNLSGAVVDKTTIVFKKNIEYRKILENIVSGVESLMKENCISFDNLLGIGIVISKTAMNYIDVTSDKPNKVKKDLSHALSTRIVATETLAGCLLGEIVFGNDKNSSDMIAVRYGKEISSGILIGGEIYRGTSGKAGGFGHLIKKSKSVVQNEKIIDAIKKMNYIIDTGKIITIGKYFDDDEVFLEIKNGLKKEINVLVQRSTISEENLFLAGSALVIKECLLDGVAL